ncbi:hypothetical protein CBOM_08128 [Ceraceosorus bombacis]|uniref:Uncharacterized protein n=1 Tax=Ceraceosorus bombacis TaxID=401625 RepID=A0A0P1B846_9BASI|nr:hypothetical protein CBOM_08128 [Ceraceosorus bombacis]
MLGPFAQAGHCVQQVPTCGVPVQTNGRAVERRARIHSTKWHWTVQTLAALTPSLAVAAEDSFQDALIKAVRKV